MRPFEGKRAVLWAEETGTLAAAGEILSRLGCRIQPAGSLEQVRWAIERKSVDLVLAELSRHFLGPLELLAWLQHEEPAPPVVVAVDVWDKDLYVESLWRGAFDGLALPLDERELIRVATKAIEARQLQLIA